MTLVEPETVPYLLWLGALAAVCGIVILKSKQDGEVITTSASPDRACALWFAASSRVVIFGTFTLECVFRSTDFVH